jgi:GT2 family glycosyltransferase
MSESSSSPGSAETAVVLLGMMSKIPVSGVVWQTLHYLVGFERLGYRAYYVEEHARTPSMLMRDEHDDSSLRAAGFIDRMLRPFGFGDRWAFHALHEEAGGWYGLSGARVQRLYAAAELIVNLHGGTEPLPEHYETGRLVFVETDPVQLQLELASGRAEASEYLAPHAALFTFAEGYGLPSCALPVSERFDFRPTRQPVVLDFWAGAAPSTGLFTTVGNWRQLWRDLEYEGQMYSWSKDQEFAKVLELPRRVGEVFELALGSVGAADAQELGEHGWRLRDPAPLNDDPFAYREYIRASAGEFTAAKDQNVRFRTGWFSDRAATYLASGRPVVVQDTGFGCALPVGEGLLAYSTLDEAAAAIEDVRAHYDGHARAAYEIAREFFAAKQVLGHMLEDVGLPQVARSQSLRIVSRRPTRLDPVGERAALDAALPRGRRPEPEPEISAVVVAADGLAFTRLAVESLLGSVALALEVVIVDNASADGTWSYLRDLAERDGRVRVVRNDADLGFAAGVNRGVGHASAPVLAILNNDVVVPPAALARMVCHLDDPAIGLVGPVSNEAATEAEIDEDWHSYGELLEVSARRAREHAGRLRDVEMLTLFCAALRRETFERVGLLDEKFGRGLFEDDDYSLRLRRAGLRRVVAEDVLVHHFGEGALGKLVPTGEYGSLFEKNRRRFERKWNVTWRPHRRGETDGYSEVVARVRETVASRVPEQAAILVVSRGDEALLDLGGRPAGHFPQQEDGTYSGYYPADSGDAIGQLEALRASGAEYLLFPKPSLWWLEHYSGFRRHLDSCYRKLDDAAPACVIYGLVGERNG